MSRIVFQLSAFGKDGATTPIVQDIFNTTLYT
jgi:hypothetical protein